MVNRLSANLKLEKGDQEEFINCSDIQIKGDISAPPPEPDATPEPIETTLAAGATCGPWQDQHPGAVLDQSDKTLAKYPTSCSEGGHEGLAGSECYITCPPTYEIVWDESGVPATRTRSLITCKDNGIWKAMGDQSSFTCQNPCPEMTKLKSKFVLTKNKWPTGTFSKIYQLRREFLNYGQNFRFRVVD